jgi:hypothetical protein
MSGGHVPKLPTEIKLIRTRYVAQFPLPSGPAGPDIEEAARQWSIGFAEQVAFERPGDGYGMKRADAGRPISKDTLSRQMDDRLLIWDLLAGAGSGHPTIVDDPDSQDVTGQVFVPVVPRRHVALVDPPEIDFAPVLMRLEALRADLVSLTEELLKMQAAANTQPGLSAR